MFDRDDLVLLWMAEGFLNQSIASKPAESLGLEYFEMLLSRSFFQLAPNEESLYVMPVLVHHLSTFVAGDYFLRCDNQMETQKEPLAKYRHMSFIMKVFVANQNFDTFKSAKRLRTLILTVSVGVTEQWDFHLLNRNLTDLLQELPLLRVLCLSCFPINELPEIIGSLKYSRYLNLSQTEITELPENVCNLYNLQTLIVFGCRKLRKLPISFLKLKNLRLFDIRNTPLLKQIPVRISELCNVKALTKIIIGRDNGFAITELKKQKNLKSEISIQGLDKVKSSMSVRDIHFSEYQLTELELKWSDVFDGSQNETLEKEVLSELKPHSESLKKLSITSYGGTEFPKWVGDPSFFRLVYVRINSCRKCASLPSLSQLRSLKEFYIEDMNKVKVVGLEFFGTTVVVFPSLEILHFRNMDGWEEWSTNSGVVFPCLRVLYIISGVVFPLSLVKLQLYGGNDCTISQLSSLLPPSLTSLEINGFYNLKSVSMELQHLTSLQHLAINYCRNIKDLPKTLLPNLLSLRINRCPILNKWSRGRDSQYRRSISHIPQIDIP